MKTYSEIINESSLARVQQHIKDRSIGMISAHRGDATPEQNAKAHAELKGAIRQSGHGYIPIKGKYVENKGTPEERHVSEPSFLVIGKKGDDSGHLKGFLKQQGAKHNQDSVLHKAHNEEHANLIGTSDRPNSWPEKDEHVNVGAFHANKAGDYHSMIKGGKKGGKTFAFESVIFESVLSFFNRTEGEF